MRRQDDLLISLVKSLSNRLYAGRSARDSWKKMTIYEKLQAECERLWTENAKLKEEITSLPGAQIRNAADWRSHAGKA